MDSNGVLGVLADVVSGVFFGFGAAYGRLNLGFD